MQGEQGILSFQKHPRKHRPTLIGFTKYGQKKEAYVKMYGLSLIENILKIDVFELPELFESFKKDGYIISLCSENPVISEIIIAKE